MKEKISQSVIKQFKEQFGINNVELMILLGYAQLSREEREPFQSALEQVVEEHKKTAG